MTGIRPNWQAPLCNRSPWQHGMALAETLVALPVLLLALLSALQLILLLQSRVGLEYAVLESARAAAVEHGQRTAAQQGLVRGLLPLLNLPPAANDEVLVSQARAFVANAQAQGWLRLRRTAPTAAAFSDWSEQARDDDGRLLNIAAEIPNDNLAHRSLQQRPHGGISGWLAGEPIGAASGTTLLEANLLRLELDYAVPLIVPLVGPLAARLLRAFDGCTESSVAAASVGLATFTYGAAARAAVGGAGPIGWSCEVYFAADEQGRTRPRWPISVAATVHMHSTGRAFD